MPRKYSNNAQGFVPLRGPDGKLDSKRRAINQSSGEVISLRQYQKLQKQSAGLAPTLKSQPQQKTPQPPKTSSKPVVAKAKSASRDYYKQEVSIFMDAKNKQLDNAGLPLYTKRSEVIRSAEFKAYYQAMKPPSKSLSADKKKAWNSPTGKKAQALVKLGLRRADADYPVGETPDTGY